jgi:putative ABC transport system substrate-binding protein
MTKTVPIIMVQVDDPIAAGFVASLARTGGDVTALSAGIGEGFAGKWVELLKEAVPSASRMAVL